MTKIQVEWSDTPPKKNGAYYYVAERGAAAVICEIYQYKPDVEMELVFLGSDKIFNPDTKKGWWALVPQVENRPKFSKRVK